MRSTESRRALPSRRVPRRSRPSISKRRGGCARPQQLQANQQYILRQIDEKLDPIFQQVMQRRGANVLVEQGSTLAAATAVDVTNDVLAALNSSLTTISTTAPAPRAPTSRRAAKAI